jgi:2-oxo-4-hydroxy-4-carboxy-5-ureidoimidazoline decarboxylase
MFSAPPSSMPKDDFVGVYGGVYEHSPWIAERVWDQGLDQTHDSVDGLAEIMSSIVDSAASEQQLELILAHPDLAGKAAQAGELTSESTGEQSAAGIDQCNPLEFERFQEFNRAYWEKFAFPFIMAVKGSDRHQILSAFEQRLPNNYATEFKQALHQIHKIARFRFVDIAKHQDNPQ